jgi:hypothetical protein
MRAGTISRQLVETRHHQHVTGVDLGERVPELYPVGNRPVCDEAVRHA